MKNSKVYLSFLTPIVMIALLFSACGGSSNKAGPVGFGVMNVLKKIPSDASVVAVMNVGQLMNKLDYKSFKETELFKVC